MSNPPPLVLRHTIILPLSWAPITLASFYLWYGDEYFMWAIASLPGWWILPLKTNSGDIRQFWSAVGPMLCAGLISMTTAGLLLDYLRIRLRWWLATVLLATPTLTLLALAQFPSLARAIAKHGSIMAYVMAALGLSMTIGIVVALVAGVLDRRPAAPATAALNHNSA